MRKSQSNIDFKIVKHFKELIHYFFIFIVFGMLHFLLPDISEALQLMEGGVYSVYINDSYQCGDESAEMTISVSDRRFFKQDPRDLQTIIYNTWAFISDTCKSGELKKIKIIGKANDTIVYEGHTNMQEGSKIFSDYIFDQKDSKNNIKISLKIRDPHYPAGIDYEGTCETNPVLPLTQVYKTDQYNAMPLDIQIKMSDYKTMGKRVAQKYSLECPEVETISFTISPVPENYVCPAKKLCYLNWSIKKPSEVLTGEFKYLEGPNDYNGIINAFIEGNYDLLDDYTGYVRLFHNDFLEVLSDVCNEDKSCCEFIENPKTFDIKNIETRYNSEGFVVSQEQIGETYRVFIDHRYADRFDSFYKLNQVWGATKIIERSMKQMTAMGRSQAIFKVAESFIYDRNLIKKFLNENKCRDKKMQTVYENLDRYYNRKPPLTLNGKTKETTEIITTSESPLKIEIIAMKALQSTLPLEHIVPVEIAIGSWKAVIEDQSIELVLWENPGNNNKLIGFAYMKKYDCLTLASAWNESGTFWLTFAEHNIKDRKNNCALNARPQNVSYDGTASITPINDNPDIINIEFKWLNLDKPVAWPKEAYPKRQPLEKKLSLELRREPLSLKMREILENYENEFAGKPDEKILSEISK